MPNDMFAWGQAWMADELHEHASETVKVFRPSTLEEFEPTAVIGQLDAQLRADFGLAESTQVIDFLIKQEEFAAFADPFPRRGDQITRTINAQDIIHDTLPLGGETVYEDSDPYQNVFRIHAKKITE